MRTYSINDYKITAWYDYFFQNSLASTKQKGADTEGGLKRFLWKVKQSFDHTILS